MTLQADAGPKDRGPRDVSGQHVGIDESFTLQDAVLVVPYWQVGQAARLQFVLYLPPNCEEGFRRRVGSFLAAHVDVHDVEIRRATRCDVSIEPGRHGRTMSGGTEDFRVRIERANNRGSVLAHSNQLGLGAGPKAVVIGFVPQLIERDAPGGMSDQCRYERLEVSVASGSVFVDVGRWTAAVRTRR